jgi:hypothetical protein
MSDLIDILFEEIRARHSDVRLEDHISQSGRLTYIHVGKLRIVWLWNDPLKIALWDSRILDKPVRKFDMYEPGTIETLFEILAYY